LTLVYFNLFVLNMIVKEVHRETFVQHWAIGATSCF